MNFTRSESGQDMLSSYALKTVNILSWNILSPASCVFAAETHRVLPHPGKYGQHRLPVQSQLPPGVPALRPHRGAQLGGLLAQQGGNLGQGYPG